MQKFDDLFRRQLFYTEIGAYQYVQTNLSIKYNRLINHNFRVLIFFYRNIRSKRVVIQDKNVFIITTFWQIIIFELPLLKNV